MKVSIKGWIVRYQASYMDEPCWLFNVTSTRPKDNDDSISVCEHTIEIEVPDEVALIPQRVAGLRAEAQRLRVRAEEGVALIREREEKLLALTNEVQG